MCIILEIVYIYIQWSLYIYIYVMFTLHTNTHTHIHKVNIFLKENSHKKRYFWRCVTWQIFLCMQCVGRLQAGTVKEKKIQPTPFLWAYYFEGNSFLRLAFPLHSPSAALLENQWITDANAAYHDMDKWHIDVRRKEVHEQRLWEALEETPNLPG